MKYDQNKLQEKREQVYYQYIIILYVKHASYSHSIFAQALPDRR
jgi:hypothetical protein